MIFFLFIPNKIWYRYIASLKKNKKKKNNKVFFYVYIHFFSLFSFLKRKLLLMTSFTSSFVSTFMISNLGWNRLHASLPIILKNVLQIQIFNNNLNHNTFLSKFKFLDSLLFFFGFVLFFCSIQLILFFFFSFLFF